MSQVDQPDGPAGATGDSSLDEVILAEPVSVITSELNTSSPADAILLEVDDPRPAVPSAPRETMATVPLRRSWPFRVAGWFDSLCTDLFGMGSMILLLAVAASLPFVQFLSLGYLFEVSGRLARGGTLRDAMVGLRKASVVGGLLLGSWLCWLPVRLVSNFWYEAYLIDPQSSSTQFLRLGQWVAIVAVLLHIFAAISCGGKLRFFFWPLIAPFSFLVWGMRRLLGLSWVRSTIRVLTSWAAPGLADDLADAQNVRDWFLPAIVWRRLRAGGWYRNARDRVWEFTTSLRPRYYFMLGFKGGIGSLGWLLLPTALLAGATFSEGAPAAVMFLAGVVVGIPVFAMLPLMQTHYSTDGRLRRFAEPGVVWNRFGRSPLVYLLALTLALVLALPLFLLKIEAMPQELLWTLSLVFVVFGWPARIVMGLAYRRMERREGVCRWWYRYPVALATLPISLLFVLILTSTRYVSWHGGWSLFENHVFLLPAPFWL